MYCYKDYMIHLATFGVSLLLFLKRARQRDNRQMTTFILYHIAQLFLVIFNWLLEFVCMIVCCTGLSCITNCILTGSILSFDFLLYIFFFVLWLRNSISICIKFLLTFVRWKSSLKNSILDCHVITLNLSREEQLDEEQKVELHTERHPKGKKKNSCKSHQNFFLLFKVHEKEN